MGLLGASHGSPGVHSLAFLFKLTFLKCFPEMWSVGAVACSGSSNLDPNEHERCGNPFYHLPLFASLAVRVRTFLGGGVTFAASSKARIIVDRQPPTCRGLSIGDACLRIHDELIR